MPRSLHPSTNVNLISEPNAATTTAESRLPNCVLHVMNSASGGAAVSTLEIINGLRDCGITSAAVCNDSGTPDERARLVEAVDGRVVFHPLYWWNRKIRSTWWKRPLIQLLQWERTGFTWASTQAVVDAATRFNVDLIHSNTLLTLEGGRAARKLRLPHVWHVRELVGPGHPYRFYCEGANFSRYVRNNASLVVANSQTTGRTLAGWVPHDMLRVISNSVDCRRFVTVPHRPENRPFTIGMIGNLTSSKKHSLFLDAAALLDRSLNLEFRVFGHLPKSETLRRGWETELVRRGLQNCVRLMGFVADPVQIMSQLDLLVHPSDQESFGRVAAEAMAAGLPVVAPRAGGVAEIVVHGETGYLTDVDSAKQIATYIELLAKDTALAARLGTAGRIRAQTVYSLPRLFEDLRRVYREALARPVTKS